MMQISLLGVVPRKSQWNICLIHHLSYSHDDSVNNGILEELAPVLYASFNEEVVMVTCCGMGTLLGSALLYQILGYCQHFLIIFELLSFTFGSLS